MNKRVSQRIRSWLATLAGLGVVYLAVRGAAALAVAPNRLFDEGTPWYSLPRKESWLAALELLPASLVLYAAVFIAVCGFGIPLGIVWGGLRTSLLRGAAGLLALFLMAIPGFALAYAVLWAAVEVWNVPVLRAFPSAEEATTSPPFRLAVEAWFVLMPACVLATPAIGKVAGEVRRALTRNMRSPSMMALKSRGLSRTRRLYRYALPASWTAAFRSVSAAMPAVIGASLLVEWIFSYPGLGARSIEAARGGDAEFLFTVLLLLGVTVFAVRAALDLAEAVFLEESEGE